MPIWIHVQMLQIVLAVVSVLSAENRAVQLSTPVECLAAETMMMAREHRMAALTRMPLIRRLETRKCWSMSPTFASQCVRRGTHNPLKRRGRSRYTPKKPTGWHAATAKQSTPRMYETKLGVTTETTAHRVHARQ